MTFLFALVAGFVAAAALAHYFDVRLEWGIPKPLGHRWYVRATALATSSGMGAAVGGVQGMLFGLVAGIIVTVGVALWRLRQTVDPVHESRDS